MTDSLDSTIPGPPVGKPRPRVTRGGKHVHYPPRYHDWLRHAVAQLSYEWTRPALDGPLRLEVWDYAQRPIRRPNGVTPGAWKSGRALVRPTKPDGDNVIGAVSDALERARVIVNDSRIVSWHILNNWAGLGQAPCVRLRLSRYEEGDE